MSFHLLDRSGLGIVLVILLVAFVAVAECTGPPATTSGQSSFDKALSNITGNPRYAHASWGLMVADPATGKTLYEKNSPELFNPASTTKLFSSAAVLEALGPDHRFVTPVYAMPAPGGGTSGTDLILVASGDPNMGGRTLPDGTIGYTNIDHGDANALQGAILTKTDPLTGLNSLALQVKASGITKVSDVVIDDRLFETTDLQKEFILSPVMINDNLIDVAITPGTPGSAPSLSMHPQTTAYILKNLATTGAAGTPLAIEIAEKNAGTILVSGTIAADAGTVNQTFSIKTPATFARMLFIEALERQGIEVAAPVSGVNPVEKLPEKGSYAGARMVASLTSPPLSEDVKLTMKVSQNMHADTYILLLAAAANKTGFYDGIMEEGKILRSLGLDTSGISLGDGEGGVREDLVSPASMAQLLTLVSRRPYAESYEKALPILGVDGSLATSCTAGNPACGHVYAKTGTTGSYDPLNNRGILLTKGLAGYIDTKSGKRLVFVVYANNMPYSDTADMMAVGNDLGSIAGLIYTWY